MNVIIYHNPDCGTSRNVLGIIRNARAGTSYRELDLDNSKLSNADLLGAIHAHPILLKRPIVVTPKGVRLCRPSEG